MDKILFLGSNSFTGYYFKKYIFDNKLINCYEFTGIDKEDSEIFSFDEIKYRKINVLHENELENLIEQEKPDYIINFIGIFKGDSYEQYIQLNCDITRNVFEIILKKRINIKNMLFIGSAAEYGNIKNLPVTETQENNPINFYGVSKLFQTILCNYYYKNYGIKNNVARTFNIIGKGLSTNLSIGFFMQQIEKAQDGDSIFVGNIDTKRDFLHIEDVVDAYWKMLIHGKEGEIYNICMGQSYSIRDVLNKLISDSGKKLSIVVKEDYVRKHDIHDIYGCNRKLKEDLNWKPTKAIIA